MKMKVYKDVDSYIKSYPDDVQKLLIQIRGIIKKSAPKAVEGISYGMPGYKYFGKPLAYFAGQKAHIGFYPTPGPILAFQKELAGYKTSKGTIQISLGKSLPKTLIAKMLVLRMRQIREGLL